jgi:hypothetical protein
MLLAFSLTRLRLSVSLRRSPSISWVESFVKLQIHLQHDSLVDDQSTQRPVDIKIPRVHRLESTLAIARRSTHLLGMCHVFPRHRIRKASALTLLRRCCRSSPSFVFIRLSSPTQPNVSTAIMLHLAPHLPEHSRALLDTFWYVILSRRTHTSPSQNNLAITLVILPANSLAQSLSKISKLWKILPCKQLTISPNCTPIFP